MADTVALIAEERKDYGTRAARRLRKAGGVPGVVYGHGEGTQSITVPADLLFKAIRTGSRIIDLKQGDQSQTALVKDIQWDPIGNDILHVDFARVSADERVEVVVSLVLRGTPASLSAGGQLSQALHEITVECLVTSIPESIRVNIGAMNIGDVIHVRELTLPEGVVAKDEPDAVVVQVVQKVDEEAVAAPLGEIAEPEVIGRKVEEETEEEK